MPLIEEQEPSIASQQWFQLDCKKDRVDFDQTEWNMRHVLLKRVAVNDWITEEQLPYDWMGMHIQDTQQCGLQEESGVPARRRAEQLRVEFEALSKRWQRDTRHLSLIAKKITHPAYFRIIGMGEAVVPLLLEELRDRPAHWFAALRATTNVDPTPIDANPSAAREAWLEWGRSKGLVG